MLDIYAVSLVVVKEVAGLAGTIGEFDRDLARQLRRSIASVALNVAEGSGGEGGTRRQRYKDALGSARESLANLEVAAAVGYIQPIDAELSRRFDHIIGVLVRCIYSRR